MKKLHAQVRAIIEKVNDQYKARANKHKTSNVFKEGDLVWLHLRKERFPNQPKKRLMPRCDGPFKILKKIGDNAYQIELPSKYGVHATFNIAIYHHIFQMNNFEV